MSEPSRLAKVRNNRVGNLDRRPKLLFLAWGFPPAMSSSCVRTWNIAKYLARLGWDITVVTPHPSLWRYGSDDDDITKNLRQEEIRRILTGHRWRLLLPERMKTLNGPIATFVGKICRKSARVLDVENAVGWIVSAGEACSSVTPAEVDVIFATGSPFSAFTLAKRLSDKLGRPYVLDYRDPWTDNPHSNRAARSATVRKEAKLLAGCRAVTVVSPSWGSLLNQRFKLGTKLNILTNGYDPEELAAVKPHAFGHCAIVYTGTFYPPKRVISPVMASLKFLKDTASDVSKEWYFHYYGAEGEHVREEGKRYDIAENVVLHGSVPRESALAAVRGARVAVVITSIGEEKTLADRGIVTGKIFEAVGLGTPILLIAPPDNDAAMIVETSGMGQRFSGVDIKGIAQFLSDQARLQPKAYVPATSYSWPALAEKLDAILRKVVDQHVYKSQSSSAMQSRSYLSAASWV